MSAHPGTSGQCGSAYGGATCLPMQGRTCCSVSGFCGSNETYCLTSNGCQQGCVDPSVFFGTTSSTGTPSTLSSSSSTLSSSILSSIQLNTTGSASATTSPSATATPTSTHGLTTPQLAGTIAGSVVAFILLASVIIYFCRRARGQTPYSGPAQPSMTFNRVQPR